MIHLDAHVAVWLYLEDTTRIPATVRARLDADDLVLAPMVVLEMEHLHEVGCLTDPATVVVASLAAGAGVLIAKVPFAACVDAALGLTWMRDPFDRLIVGTAMADPVVREHHVDSSWG